MFEEPIVFEDATYECMDCVPHPGDTHMGIALVIDCSGSVASQMDEINQATASIVAEISRDARASRGVDLMVVAVGTADRAEVVQPFAPIAQVTPPVLGAGGYTPLNEGILLAEQGVRDYNHRLAREGVPYRTPWLVVVSDGYATDKELEDRMLTQVRDAVNRGSGGHLALWFVGTDGFSEPYARQLPTPRVLHLKDHAYGMFANWLVENARIQSRTKVGEKAAVAPLPPGMEIPEAWCV